MGCLGDVTRAKDRRRRRRRRRRRKLSTRVPGSDDRVAAGNLSESSKFSPVGVAIGRFHLTVCIFRKSIELCSVYTGSKDY